MANRERPERKVFLDAFAREASQIPGKQLTVLDLGSGPGFLAEELLDQCSISKYYLFDISPFMHQLSRSRLKRFLEKTAFLEGDFKNENWSHALPRNLDLVVSLQAVHELRHARHIPRFYKQVYRLLASGGLFLVCDHVNSRRYGAAHFMTVAEHVSTLEAAGFTDAKEVLSKRDMSLIRGWKG